MRTPLLLLFCGCVPIPNTPCETGDPSREDLNTLTWILDHKHADPWLEISFDDFTAEVLDRCDGVTDNPTRGAIAAMELAALLGDPHTRVRYDFERLPLRIEFFGDDLYVIAADDETLTGARVTHIGGNPITRSREVFADLVAHHNAQWLDVQLARLLVRPALLADRGWSDGSTVELTLDHNGTTREQSLQVGSFLEEDRPTLTPAHYDNPTTLAGNEPPLWLSQPDAFYSVDVRDDMVWFRASTILDHEDGPSLQAFWKANVLPALDGDKRLVVDVRHNYGGNFNKIVPVLEALAGHPIDHPDTLFVVTDGHTFSAAQYAAWTLLTHTRATHVGTEPGDTLSSWLDTNPFTLRRSGLDVYVSQRDPLYGSDRGGSLIPSIETALSWQDYVSGRDPVREALLSR